MKKLSIFLFSMFLAIPVFADIITFDSAVTNSDITRPWLNNTFHTVYNEVNGNLNTDNIKDGGIASADFSTAVNPLVRDNELIGEFVYSGLTMATSVTLSSTITAGTAYVENDSDNTLVRVVTDATAKTFTASKDTYVYLSSTGAFAYKEVANGASQPVTDDNYMLILKAVTDGTAITSVTDYRSTTPLNLRIYNDYIQGCALSRDVSTATKVNALRGEMEFGTAVTAGIRRNTTSCTIDFSTTGRGGLDTGSLYAGSFYYIHGVADDGNVANWEMIGSLSSSDASGVTGERLIGWAYATSASVISPDSIGAYKGRGGDSPNICMMRVSADYALSGITAQDVPGLYLKFYSSGRPVRLTLHMGGAVTTSVTGINTMFNVDGVDITASDKTAGGSQSGYNQEINNEYVFTPGAGEHTIKVRVSCNATSAITLQGRTLTAEEL